MTFRPESFSRKVYNNSIAYNIDNDIINDDDGDGGDGDNCKCNKPMHQLLAH